MIHNTGWMKSFLDAPAKWRRRTRLERLLLLEAFLLLGVARLAVLALPFKWLAASLGEHMQETDAKIGAADLNLARKVGQAIRKTSYYDLMLTQREAAAEMRLFALGGHFRSLFRRLRERLRREKVDLARSEATARATASLIGLASMAVALAWMGRQVLSGVIGLGGLALFCQAFYQGQRMMRSLLGSAGEIYRNIMFLENLFEFLDLKPRIGYPEKPVSYLGLQNVLEFQNVTFCYSGAARPALERFNLRIPAGRITALVGENGAGKTTLIKLICRFYDPDKGCLLIDGTDIKNLPPDKLRQQITVLFQEPVHYHDSVFNNIAFGDIANRPDRDRIEAAAVAAGADAPINRLPATYEAVLGKWFGGSELSGGEWQRLALARAFLRNAGLIILDEPTSAMDSWAEADWLLRFRKLVAGRTSLIITHRFTTALQADIIHVMDKGRIIESGSHEELLAARISGLSRERWQALLSLARAQRVMSLLRHRIRQKGLEKAVPVAVVEAFKDAFRQNTQHNMRFYGDLRRLLSALESEGIPLILLKGIFLADAVYGFMGLREMNDIDVLAHPADLLRISEILADMGYKPLQAICPDTTLKSEHHLPRMVKKGHADFEIHWNLTSPYESYSIDPKSLWERAVPVRIAGGDAQTLSPEDLLLHLCLHTSYQHQFAFGLRPSCDIAETIDRFGSSLDWRIITNQAVQWGWQRGVYLALHFARELAGANVPTDILESLRPSDVTDTVIEAAHTQIFTDKKLAVSIPVPFAKLLESNNFWGKIRIFRQQVFLPKAIIASQYSVPMDSAKIYFCYPRRIVDVLRRHGHTLRKHQQNDASLKFLARRIKIIANWLNQPTIL